MCQVENCKNWNQDSIARGKHCYNCIRRKGFPYRAQPDKRCANFGLREVKNKIMDVIQRLEKWVEKDQIVARDWGKEEFSVNKDIKLAVEKIKALDERRIVLEKFMKAAAETVGCLPSYADPHPERGNVHIVKQLHCLINREKQLSCLKSDCRYNRQVCEVGGEDCPSRQ